MNCSDRLYEGWLRGPPGSCCCCLQVTRLARSLLRGQGRLASVCAGGSSREGTSSCPAFAVCLWLLGLLGIPLFQAPLLMEADFLPQLCICVLPKTSLFYFLQSGVWSQLRRIRRPGLTAQVYVVCDKTKLVGVLFETEPNENQHSVWVRYQKPLSPSDTKSMLTCNKLPNDARVASSLVCTPSACTHTHSGNATALVRHHLAAKTHTVA